MNKVASRLDLLLAMRVILYARDLSPPQKAVGCAIAAHYNEETGQCDPGIERIADLVGVKRDTVFRTLKKLEAEPFKIVTRKTYGGKHHRNSYALDWVRIRELAKRVNSRSRGTVKAKSEPSLQGDGEPSLQGDTNVLLAKRDGDLRRREVPDGIEKRGLPRRSSSLDGPSTPISLDAHRRAPSHKEAAEAAVHRRLMQRISALPRTEQEAAWLSAMATTG